MLINGEKVKRPTKADMSAEIAVALDLEDPAVSGGSSVDSTFLDRIHEKLDPGTSAGRDAYRKVQRVMQDLELTYDPFWDTSESAEEGGSTVTARAFSRIRASVTDTPRCFILNTTDAPVGAKWETDHQTVYRYDDTVTARHPFNDAGPGSRVIFYSTSKSSRHPMHFIGHAEVHYISPGWVGPWEAQLTGYTEFPNPVPRSEFEMDGWNNQHAITEISWPTYESLVVEGLAEIDPPAIETEDPGGDVVAERVLDEFPADEAHPSLEVPASLPDGRLQAEDPIVPTYVDSPDDWSVQGPSGPGLPPRSPRDRKRDKLAELRAVELTTAALIDEGWTLVRDCQRDGVGFDLLFGRANRRLKVEIKGVQGPLLEFNLTPKEFWRAETDPDFVVVAVTSVLSPRNYKLQLLTRDKVVSAQRAITGFRITI